MKVLQKSWIATTVVTLVAVFSVGVLVRPESAKATSWYSLSYVGNYMSFCANSNLTTGEFRITNNSGAYETVVYTNSGASFGLSAGQTAQRTRYLNQNVRIYYSNGNLKGSYGPNASTLGGYRC